MKKTLQEVLLLELQKQRVQEWAEGKGRMDPFEYVKKGPVKKGGGVHIPGLKGPLSIEDIEFGPQKALLADLDIYTVNPSIQSPAYWKARKMGGA